MDKLLKVSIHRRHFFSVCYNGISLIAIIKNNEIGNSKKTNISANYGFSSI